MRTNMKTNWFIVFTNYFYIPKSPDMYYKVIGEQLGVKDILTMAKLRFALEVLDTNA